MKHPLHSQSPASSLDQQSVLTPEVLSLLTAHALSQAHAARQAIERIIVPRIPPQNRCFAQEVLRRMDGVMMFRDRFLRDLESFIAAIEERVDAGTSIYWHSDEHHIEGGFEVTVCDEDASALGAALHELMLLRDRLVKVLAAARALQEEAVFP